MQSFSLQCLAASWEAIAGACEEYVDDGSGKRTRCGLQFEDTVHHKGLPLLSKDNGIWCRDPGLEPLMHEMKGPGQCVFQSSTGM